MSCRFVLPAALALLAVSLAAFASSASADPNALWVGPAMPDAGNFGTDPHVSMNSRGEAVAVWFIGNETWAASYAPGGWAAPTRINVNHTDAVQAMAPRVAFDDNGNAAASWGLLYRDSMGTEWGEAYAALYTSGVGWSAEHLVGPADSITGDTPQVAIGPGGRVFVTYLDATDIANPAETCAMYIPGMGWQMPHVLGTANATWMSAYAQVVADSTGAVAVWDLIDLNDFSTPEVWGATYTAGSGWSAARRIDRGFGQATIYGMTMSNGVAYVTLLDVDAMALRSIGLYTWSASAGWSAGQTVAGPLAKIGRAELAADPGGNLTLLYTDDVNATTRNLWGRYYGGASGWSVAQLIENQPGLLRYRSAAPDQNGGALVVFDLSVGTTNRTFWTRYVPGVGWRAEQLIHEADARILAATIVSSPYNALATWAEDLGPMGWHIQSYAFARDDLQPFFDIVEPSGAILNTSTVEFWGTADPAARLFVDGALVVVQPWGVWTYNRTLADGDHILHFMSVDDDLNTFQYDLPLTIDTVSHLEVTSPAEYLTETSSAIAAVGGLAEPGSLVSINGLPVLVATNGSFSYIAILVFSLNVFDVVAVDPAGNTANVTVNIRQVLPDSGIDEARAEIANLTANLTAALDELSAAQADVTALEANASVSQGEVAAARARLTLAEGNVTALNAQLTLANTALAKAQADATKAQQDAAKAQADADAASARADAAQSAAGGANVLAILGVALGAAGLAVGILGMMRGKKPHGSGELKAAEPPQPPT